LARLLKGPAVEQWQRWRRLYYHPSTLQCVSKKIHQTK